MLQCPSGVRLSLPAVPGALCSAGTSFPLLLLGKAVSWLSYCLPKPLSPALLPSCPSWNGEDGCLLFRDVLPCAAESPQPHQASGKIPACCWLDLFTLNTLGMFAPKFPKGEAAAGASFGGFEPLHGSSEL